MHAQTSRGLLISNDLARFGAIPRTIILGKRRKGENRENFDDF